LNDAMGRIKIKAQIMKNKNSWIFATGFITVLLRP
jgi:hypothetical protein